MHPLLRAEDDNKSDLLSGTRTCTHRQHDGHRDVDDMEGIEDVFSFLCPSHSTV